MKITVLNADIPFREDDGRKVPKPDHFRNPFADEKQPKRNTTKDYFYVTYQARGELVNFEGNIRVTFPELSENRHSMEELISDKIQKELSEHNDILKAK